MKAHLALVGALLLTPLALAQDTDPTVNESDFDTSAPPADDAYLNDTSESASADPAADPADPTVTDDDFDTSVPTEDTAYLDDAADGASASNAVPGIGLALFVGALSLAALLIARKR